MKKLFTYLLLILAISTMTSNLVAQGIVKGKLIDKGNKEPLIGAAVFIENNKGVGTVTSLDGTFSLKIEGEQNLIFSYMGYVNISKTVNANVDIDLGIVELKSSAMGIDEISIIASIAIDRKTPIAMSSIKPEMIAAKLGSQELPEILKSTPGVYVTRQGGGFGDSRINVRGFDMKNTAVLINGIPVNDMENGWVYMSNWASLSEVTRDIQVQRGLGASKLSIGSVGGTINYITNTTNSEAGGSVYTGMGDNGYKKTSFTLNTGLMDNGWAITASGARTIGDGWADGTQFQAWSYFVSITKRWEKQSLSLTAFGAPQTHGQRSTKQNIETIKDPNKGLKYNPDWGYKNGQVYNLNTNFYHKPLISLNHFIELSEKAKLVSSAYVSFGTGGGTGNFGSEPNKFYSNDYKVEGQIDFDKIVNENIANGSGGSTAIIRSSRNDHNWYGLLSNLNYDLSDNVNISAGIDLRYYKGKHFREVTDLLGGDFVFDNSDMNTPLKLAKVGDKIGYNNDGEVLWEGIFAQAEYAQNDLSAFISASASNTSYRRTDYFHYLNSDSDKQSEWVNNMGFVTKGGANYNLSSAHHIFANIGYFERAPFFDAVFYDYNSNKINEGVKNEKVLSFELGYGFRSSTFTGNINGYYTNWKDKFLRKTIPNTDGTTVNANLTGVDALHMGIEIDLKWQPIEKLEVRGMASLGNYKWQKDLTNVILYNDDLQPTDTVNIYMKDLKVGDAAQTTMALGFDYELLKNLKVGADYNYYANYYASFDPTGRTNIDKVGIDAWKAPAYGLLDLNVSYNFEIAGLSTTVYGNVFNVLNTEYISDATDGSNNDWQTAKVFYGVGRTFTTGIKINF